MDTKCKPCFKLLPGHLAQAVAGTGGEVSWAPRDFSYALKPSDHQGRGKRTGPVPSTHSPNDRIGIHDMSMNIHFLHELGVITKY